MIYALLSRNFDVRIYALFPQIFGNWIVDSADFFTFRMYARALNLKEFRVARAPCLLLCYSQPWPWVWTTFEKLVSLTPAWIVSLLFYDCCLVQSTFMAFENAAFAELILANSLTFGHKCCPFSRLIKCLTLGISFCHLRHATYIWQA